MTKKELLDTVWADVEVTENALTHCIKEARAALDDNVQTPEFLRTIPRLGYEFVADVETLNLAANEEVIEEEFHTVQLITTEEDTDYSGKSAEIVSLEHLGQTDSPCHVLARLVVVRTAAQVI